MTEETEPMTDPVRPVAPREDELIERIIERTTRETVFGEHARYFIATLRKVLTEELPFLAAAPVPCAAAPGDPLSETWMASVMGSGSEEVFYVPERGWSAQMLGYSEGVGPYFSLPEALHRVEEIIGAAVWKPRRIIQRATGAGARDEPPSRELVDALCGPAPTVGQPTDRDLETAPGAVARDPHRLPVTREELIEALEEYGAHDLDDCGGDGEGERCTCGLDELLARLRGEAAGRVEE